MTTETTATDGTDGTVYAAAAARVAGGAGPTAEATAIVAMMIDDELFDCLDGDIDFWPGLADMIGGGYSEHTYPGGACPRLGVPGIEFSDGPRGVVVGQATCFPVSMARAATWDPDLEERIGAAIGLELRRIGATFYGGVCVNLLRHPAWGRAQETYGEDPVLLAEMGAALSRGAQQYVMACVKHFALNSMENARFTVDVTVDDRALHEVYLPHFRAIVDQGVASVMSAYNSVNGEWCGQHRTLLTDILRRQWGFDGFVISDFISGTRHAGRSVRAGLDIEMPFRMVRRQ
jgi:beta-glucosidase